MTSHAVHNTAHFMVKVALVDEAKSCCFDVPLLLTRQVPAATTTITTISTSTSTPKVARTAVVTLNELETGSTVVLESSDVVIFIGTVIRSVVILSA